MSVVGGTFVVDFACCPFYVFLGGGIFVRCMLKINPCYGAVTVRLREVGHFSDS